MREVSFVSAGAGQLVLMAADGEKLTLTIDDQLRTAVRLAPSAKPTTDITPREIQDAVRSGATVEQIVQSSGADEDFVRKFATPVIEELAHMVSSALSVRVEIGIDRFNETQFAEFGELISNRLAVGGATGVTWLANRETPTTWLIAANFSLNGEQGLATWSFDPRRFTLSPENATAISLSNNAGLNDSMIPKVTQFHPANSSQVDTSSETTLLDAFRARREAALSETEAEEVAKEAAAENEPEAEVQSEPSTPSDESASPKRGRAPMPTWDEIVFGAKTED